MSLPPSSAPTATGWSDSYRAGFAPAEEWRLSRRTTTERLPLTRSPWIRGSWTRGRIVVIERRDGALGGKPRPSRCGRGASPLVSGSLTVGLGRFREPAVDLRGAGCRAHALRWTVAPARYTTGISPTMPIMDTTPRRPVRRSVRPSGPGCGRADRSGSTCHPEVRVRLRHKSHAEPGSARSALLTGKPGDMIADGQPGTSRFRWARSLTDQTCRNARQARYPAVLS